MKNSLDYKIDNLIKLFNKIESEDNNHFTPEIKEIRHWITYFHSKIESDLDFILALSLTKELNTFSDDDYRRYTVLLGRMSKLVRSYDFAKKIELAFAANDIDESLKNLLFKVNDKRVIFAHSFQHNDSIKQFKDKNIYLNTLKLLIDCHSKIEEVFNIYFKKLDDFINSVDKVKK